jgi:hypothetical protein
MMIEAQPRAYLGYRPQPMKLVGLEWVHDPDTNPPAEYENFEPFEGTYAEVAQRADFLNNIQHNSGYVHYLFWPELVPTRKSTDPHCPYCGHDKINIVYGTCFGCWREADVERWVKGGNPGE